jgi:hypothetical protein
MPRLAKDSAAAIGFITAVVAFGKLIYEGWPWFVQEGWPWFEDVLPWLGAVFYAALLVYAVYWPIRHWVIPRRRPDLDYIWIPLFPLFLPVVLWMTTEGLRFWLTFFALTGLGASALIGGIQYVDRLRNRPALRECPHCLERVNKEASVCRHCGRDLPAIEEGAAVPEAGG